MIVDLAPKRLRGLNLLDQECEEMVDSKEREREIENTIDHSKHTCVLLEQEKSHMKGWSTLVLLPRVESESI